MIFLFYFNDCLDMLLIFFLITLACQQNILKLSKQFMGLFIQVMLELSTLGLVQVTSQTCTISGLQTIQLIDSIREGLLAFTQVDLLTILLH